MAELLNFSQSSDELLWVAEALDQGIVKEKAQHPVTSIIEAKNGRGYLIVADVNGTDVCDFAWKKSTPGKLLAAIIEDPSKADDNQIMLTMQSAVKCACLTAKAVKNTKWFKTLEADTVKITCAPATVGNVRKLTGEIKEAS
jgi:hypothetical protein